MFWGLVWGNYSGEGGYPDMTHQDKHPQRTLLQGKAILAHPPGLAEPPALAILLLSNRGPEALVDVQEEDWTWPKHALQVPALHSKGHRQLACLLSFLIW